MARIHLLGDDIINKIAAGEVIDRPASIVKELVENAIDASSDAITIELLDGGCKQIIIRDNGCGMPPEDARLAITRHATSKISSADDLFAIHSLGFRGEALAAIASVSKLSLSTFAEGEHHSGGITLSWHGGQLVEEKTWFAPSVGTVIAIEDIFYNIPVRAKFLKSPLGEFAQCFELIQAFALAHPRISFQLLHNGKTKLATFAERKRGQDDEQSLFPQPAQVNARIAQVWGEELASRLLPIVESNQFGTVQGFISPPGFEKQTAKNIVFIVNGRYVKDKVLRFGMQRGYHSHLLKGAYPQLLCFINCDPSLIDVNVHPAKTELRFQYPAEVQALLARAIRQGLRAAQWAGSDEPAPPAPEAGIPFLPSYLSSASPRPLEEKFPRLAVKPTEKPKVEFSPKFRAEGPALFVPHAPATAEIIPWASMQRIGSLFNCYVILEAQGRVLVVDQHAFHERILYERYSNDPALIKDQQPLIIPELIKLEAHALAELQNCRAELADHGFIFRLLESEEEGGVPAEEGWLEIQGVPLVVAGRDLERLFRDLLSGAQEHPLENHHRLVHHILATLACHSAVRAGEELSNTDWLALLAAAEKVDFYHNCPHGRRVFKWFSRREVEAWFDR